MTETSVSIYLMNPAEDVIVPGNQLANGMWVLPEEPTCRHGRGGTEDTKIRAQRFCQITQLTRTPAADYAGGIRTTFIGEWVDGYQEVFNFSPVWFWLVKKTSISSENGSAAPPGA